MTIALQDQRPAAVARKKENPTSTVRVEVDVAEIATKIVGLEGGTVASLLSGLLRPQLEARYAKLIAREAEKLAAKAPKKGGA